MGSILCCVEDKRNFESPIEKESLGELAQDTSTSFKVLKHPIEHKESNKSSLATAGDVGEASDKQLKEESLQSLVNDHLSDFELDIDDDQEISELEQYRNEYEQEIKFTKNGLITAIEKQLEIENTEPEAKKWELKLNKDDVKVYLKKGGSHITNDHTYIRTEVLFNSYYQMNKVLTAIFKESHRLKWDKNILKYELIPVVGNSVVLNYQLNKAPLNFQNKDFLDKQVKFSKDGKFYCYYCLVPNDLEIKPSPEKVGRAVTYIGMQKMERRQEDGKIKYTMLMQCDLKMNITPKLIGMFLPNGMQDWSKKINKYLSDNYDKIE